MAELPRSRETNDSLKLILEHHCKYVLALRAGGFVCFLPGLIDGSWDQLASRLAGLPLAICFNGLPQDIDCQPLPFMLTSTYWVDPRTYLSSGKMRAVFYRSRPANSYRVEVYHDLKTGLWMGRKFRDEQLVLEATGREVWEFIIHFTMAGRAADEPAEAWQTLEDVGAQRVYLWLPSSGDVPAVGEPGREAPG
jgi:hypothetical protein